MSRKRSVYDRSPPQVSKPPYPSPLAVMATWLDADGIFGDEGSGVAVAATVTPKGETGTQEFPLNSH